MTSTKQTNLLKVTTINKRYANQMEVVRYDKVEHSNFKRIQRALESRHIAPLGWLEGIHLENAAAIKRYWLVKFVDQWYWFPVPDEGRMLAYYHNAPQLFI